MKTRLIVLIDFSAENLFKFAGLWSDILKADLLLIHQVPGLIPSLADGESRAIIIEEEKKEAMAKLKSLVYEHFPQVENVKYHVSEQSLLSTVKSVGAQEPEYRNVVLAGLKTRGLLQQLLFGSTTSRLIDEVDYPLIAIPANIDPFIPEKLILALSYRYPLNQASYHRLLDALEETIQISEIISVVTPNDEVSENEAYLRKLTSEIKKDIPTTYMLFKGEEPLKEIKKYIFSGQRNSLLVVQKGSRSLSDQFFRKFFINELVHDGSIPLVVIPS
jgi:hypothetical protein